MKTTFWAVFMALVFAAILCSVLAMYGCASHAARYTGLDDQGKPYTIELTAKRFIMGQEVSGFAAEFPGGYKVGFDASKSDPVKTMESFFHVLGPILQDYMDRRNGMSSMRSPSNPIQ